MLAYERHGCGEPVILVHGIAHRRQAWHPVLDYLVDHRDVILIDLPGHGESGPLELNGRPLQIVLKEVFEKALADIGLEKAHVVGNSLGGRIALESVVNGHALSATAFSPAGFWRNNAEFEVTNRLFRTVIGASRRLEPVAARLVRTKAGRKALFGWITAHPTYLDPDRALGDFMNLRRAESTMLEILEQATRFEAELDPSVPVTIAWAGRDVVLPRYQARVAKRQIPHATHLMMPGVGHVPMSDAPELVAKIILDATAPRSAEQPHKPASRIPVEVVRPGRNRPRAMTAAAVALLPR